MLQKSSNHLKWVFLFLSFFIFNNITFAKMDKFRCIWRDDPATTMTIAWNQVSGNNPVLYYDTHDYGAVSEKYKDSQKPNKTIDSRGLQNVFVRLTNLQPKTKYYFIIKDSEGKSTRYWFETAPNNSKDRLSIIAGGDSRNHREGRQNANMLVAKLRPTCVVFGGDMTGLDIEREWREWFDDWQLTIAKDGRMTPIITARGNHEKSNETLVNLFDVPNSNVYYALNLGGNLLRIYTLNTMIATGGEQKAWLENDLKNNDYAIWKMAQYHHPMRPHTQKKVEGTSTSQNWAQLFYDYNVQLAVECDAHVCKTTYPIRPSYEKGSDEGFIRDDARGTVFIGEGCWGAPLRPADDSKNWTRAAGSFNQIKWVWLDSKTMEIRTIKTDNASVVSSLTDDNRFAMPKNIDIWKPSTGAVITLQQHKNTPAVAVTETKIAPVTKPKATNSTTKPTTPKPSTSPIITTPKPTPRASTTETYKINSLVIKSMNIEKLDKVAVITWKTAGEPEGVVCDLQRSIDDLEYTTVARLVLLGNTQKEQTYQLTDNRFEEQLAPFVYYRLRSTLPNGEQTFSNKERIAAKKASDFETIAVNESAIYIEYHLKQEGDVTFQITDNEGNSYLYQTYIKQLLGEQIKRISLDGIKSGTYILSVKLTDGTMLFRQLVIND